jgi:Eukaryotic aspartyl protease
MHWYPLKGYSWWEIEMVDASYGGSTIRNQAKTTCIVDTGTTLIAIPSADFEKLARKWMKDDNEVLCSSELCYKIGTCNNLWKPIEPIEFKFADGFTFSIPSTMYLIDGSKWDTPGYCIFGI